VRVEGFVIHLARATQRRPLVERLIAESPVAMQVFDAVDGRAMPEADLRARYSELALHAPPYPFRIGVGEIACFLSHRAIWERMIEERIDFALILEDDVEMDAAQVGRAVDFVVGRADVDVYVELQTRPLTAGEVVAEEAGLRIIRPHLPPLRTSAQIVGRGAAARLLAASERFDRPIDCLLQLVSVTGQEVLCASPSGVRDASGAVGGSVAQSGKRQGLGERLLREWRRFRYRQQVRRLASKAAARSQRV
jgi:GR25 family glycosyltransferase involved in LPS biosynthesis